MLDAIACILTYLVKHEHLGDENCPSLPTGKKDQTTTSLSKMTLQIRPEVCAFLAWFVPSNLLLTLIRKYHNEKSTGLQTILDFLIVDSVHLFLFFNAVSVIVFVFVTFHLHVFFPLILTHLVFIVTSISLVSFLASLQVIQIVKTILIFKWEWFEHYPDHEVLKYSRIFVFFYTYFRFMIDWAPASTNITKAVTGTDEEL